MVTIKLCVFLVFCGTVACQPGHEEGHLREGALLETILACLLVWLVTMVGAALPKKFVIKHNRRLIALSIGSLSGTIFFELIPHHTLNFHFEPGDKNAEYVLSSVLLGGIFFGFVIESVVHATSQGHSHGHRGCGNECEELELPDQFADEILAVCVNEGDVRLNDTLIEDIPPATKADNEDNAKENEVSLSRPVSVAQPRDVSGEGGKQVQIELSDSEKIKKTQFSTEKPTFCFLLKHLPTIVMVDFVAKLVHHFADGALIGILFLIDSHAGLAIAISVAAHEISASLGSFALYMSVGVKKRVAIFVGGMSSVTIVIGGVVAVGVKEHLSESKMLNYLPTFAAGLFIYLTLADLLPLLMHASHGTHDKSHSHQHHSEDATHKNQSFHKSHDGHSHVDHSRVDHSHADDSRFGHSHADHAHGAENSLSKQSTSIAMQEPGYWEVMSQNFVLFGCFAVGLSVVVLILMLSGHEHPPQH